MPAQRLVEQAAAHEARKEYADALACAERALEQAPDSIEALRSALYCAAKLEQPAVFRRHAKTARAHAGKERPRLSNPKIGRLALQAGAHDVAGRIGARLLDKDPASRVGRLLLAAALWETGRVEYAEAVIQDGLIASGGDAAPAGGVGAAIEYRLRLDEVDRAAQLLGVLDPAEPWAEVAVAEAYLRRDDPARASEAVRSARARGVADQRLDAIAATCAPRIRVLDGSWRGPVPAASTTPVKGRVLHLVSRSLPYHHAGATYRTHDIGRAQIEAGLEPVFMTAVGFPRSAGHDAQPPETLLDGVRYVHVAAPASDDIGLDERLWLQTQALLAYARRSRPAVLHAASDFRNALVALEAGKALGIPVVYEVRSFPEERRRRLSGSRVLAERSAARRELEHSCLLAADHVVTLGQAMREHIAGKGVEPSRITVVPNAVHRSLLAGGRRDRSLAAALGIGRDDFVLGCVSTFQPWEAIDRIIDATAELAAAGRPVRALLVGDGRAYDDLVSHAKQRGISSRVIFTGRVDHARVPDLYRLMDVFICPRRPEPALELVTPLKPYEAMALEVAVVVSATPALCEIVQDGVTGRTFRADDMAHLVSVCWELIDDPRQRARLARNARRWVRRERTWSSNGRRYRELYERLGAA